MAEGTTMNLVSTIIVLTAAVALVGCETNGAAVGDIRQTAMNACANRADGFWNAAPGTSVVNEGEPDEYGNWILQVGTGGYQSTCTVTPGGQVVKIDPG
jgi:hypothetical protein